MKHFLGTVTRMPVADDPPAISGYTLHHRIGTGASGTVWLAEENLTGLFRAVKIVQRPTESGRPALSRELEGIHAYQQAAGEHPNLLTVFHVGETEDGFFCVMELADPSPERPADDIPSAGGLPSAQYEPRTLAALIRHEVPLDPGRALEITRQVLEGLKHLHAHGLIHRDVKPSNILFIHGRVKVADVGLVTNLDHTLTQVGTPGYMPPEGAVDQRADLYAAGVMLYEMITGYPRTKFPELPANLAALTCKTRRDRRTLTTAIRIASKAANWDRRKRFQSVGEFLQAISSSPRIVLPVKRAIVIPLVAAAAILIARSAIIGTIRQAVSAVQPSGTPQRINVDYRDGSEEAFEFPWAVCRPLIVQLDTDRPPMLIVGTPSSATNPGHLLVVDPHQDPVKAIARPVLDLAMYQPPPAQWNHQPFYPPCSVVPVWKGNLDDKAGDELVVAVVHEEGPTRLVIFGSGWRILSEFWHYGHLTAIQAHDLERDGKCELICRGLTNERTSPEPFGKQDEPLHGAIMIIDPMRRAIGRWSMNLWMNDTANPPLAYGYVKPPTCDFDNDPFLIQGVVPYPGDGRPDAMRVRLLSGETLELDARLRPLLLRSPPVAVPTPPDARRASEIWTRN